VNINWQNV